MNDEKGANRTVGYGKPPVKSQFKKGQSGNPKGRPRRSKSLDALLTQALSEQVDIIENGRRKKISKRNAMLKQLANRAALGDPRVAKFVFDQEAKSKGSGGDRPPPKTTELPDEFSFWVNVVIVLWECGALECAPPGLKEAIAKADWERVKKIAGSSQLDVPDIELDSLESARPANYGGELRGPKAGS